MSKAMTGDDKKTLVPKLRFPEFRDSEAWAIKSLGEVCDMQAGEYVNAADIRDMPGRRLYPCYGGNGLRGFTNTFTHDGTYSLIGRQGALCGNVTAAVGKFHATEHAVVATPVNNISTDWLYNELCVLRLNRYATGQAQPGLSVANLKKITVHIPRELDEQQEVADCLSSLDTLIAAHTDKLAALKTHKKGLLQQLFPRDGETVPRLRFPEFRNAPEWEVKPLARTAENLDNKRIPINAKDRTRGNVPYYGASGVVDFVKEHIFDEDLLCVSEDGANLVTRTCPIAFSITGRTWVNNHAHVLRFGKNATQRIVEAYLNASDLRDFITGMAQPKLNRSMLDIIPIPLPDADEQQRIVDCISSLDTLITAQADKIEALKQHKQGLLQQLFPAMDEAAA